MLFDHISIGGGVIGFNSTEKIINQIIDNKNLQNRNFNFAIIDKKINNIEGGIAYNPKLARYGYFNNPIRLSPISFVKYIKNKKFKQELLKYLNNQSGYVDRIWKKKYFKTLDNIQNNKFEELYLPRASYGIWQKNRIFNLLNNIKKFNNNKNNIKINLFFYESEINEITSENKILKLFFDNSFNKFQITKNIRDSELLFSKEKKIINEENNQRYFEALNCTIGIGLNPPRKYTDENLNDIKNYIWDFYAEGSTNNLINLIKKNKEKNNFKKKLKVFFIGYKAGLLESLPELNELITQKNLKIKLFAISSSLETIQKAELNNNKIYKFKYLTKNQICKITKAKEIINFIKKEFTFALTNGFSKYHAWTKILKENILQKMLKKLSILEKTKYEKKYFTILRNLTRFTYPLPIEIKDKMIEKGNLKLIKGSVLNITDSNNKLVIITNKQKFIADIVINVSGPMSTNKINSEVRLIKNLKKNLNPFNEMGFVVKKNFSILNHKNIFIPGTLASGFNPNRITILNSILLNSDKSSKFVYKRIVNLDKNKLIFNNLIKNKNKSSIKITTIGGITARKDVMQVIKNNRFINNKSFPIKIILDGKAGAGKSTFGKFFTEIFDSILIDTGYIFKAASYAISNKKIYKKNYNSVDINKYISVINKIDIKDLLNEKLDQKSLIEITSMLANNKKIRVAVNKKIKYFGDLFSSCIFTGRDTGSRVFNKKNDNVIKFFILISDKIAALRKDKQLIGSKNKNRFFNTTERNNSDKKNIIIAKDAIIIDNNKNNYAFSLKVIFDHINNKLNSY